MRLIKMLPLLAVMGTVAHGFAGDKAVFVECEQFENRGGWFVDSQFIDLMGSSFLMAHGIGVPVADASTHVDVPCAGKYNVYARTRNWVAFWSDEKNAPGRFEVVVNGTRLDGSCDQRLGTGDVAWRWYQAGAVDLPKGKVEVRLHDLTGFDGRCDAIVLVPADNVSGEADGMCEALRPKSVAKDMKEYDLVVVGGGIAGVCTAVSAARSGVKVALVQDRPMLGGNNSSEVRVHISGDINLAPYDKIGDVVAEVGPRRFGTAQPPEFYEDERKLAVVKAEKNIDLFLNTRVTEVEKDGSCIKSVIGRNVTSGERFRFRAHLFADCTGDGCVGVLAGADHRYGREGRGEAGEAMAPIEPDKIVMGASILWNTTDFGKKVSFPCEPWMIKFDESNCAHELLSSWNWETGHLRDQVKEFERIRDYGMLAVYSNWSYLKNLSDKKSNYATKNLKWVSYTPGKRESVRLMGDHIMTQKDVFERKEYNDGTCMVTWPIDVHEPLPVEVTKFKGEPFRASYTHVQHYPYPIPYRCLYSRNVNNLFMAGRNVSVTHVGLGMSRVMRTTGMMGEVVGMAAGVCTRNKCLPRDVYTTHLDELKCAMKKGVGLGKPQASQKFGLSRMLRNGDAESPEDIPPAGLEASLKQVQPAVESVMKNAKRYMVIDLTGGHDAASYPVSYLDDVPAGGWSDEYKTNKLVLRNIPSGTFVMGCPLTEFTDFSCGDYDLRNEVRRMHRVTITRDFWIGVFEVTQRQWELVMGTNPSYFVNAECKATRPVERVSYDMIRGASSGALWPVGSEADAESFIGTLRRKVPSLRFDLPTEAQWEYACRAGTTTAFNNGKGITGEFACSSMDEVGRYGYNGGSGADSPLCTTEFGTAKVGSYKPNAWGLYDMHGNVPEWCLDWYVTYGFEPTVDPKGAKSGSYRILRGGGWNINARYCRSAYRTYYVPSGSSYDFCGLRLAVSH